jgi:hypothetical protein
MRTALIHEWLTTYAGSERVVEQILKSVVVERVFTLVRHLDDRQLAFLGNVPVTTSGLQRMPF